MKDKWSIVSTSNIAARNPLDWLQKWLVLSFHTLLPRMIVAVNYHRLKMSRQCSQILENVALTKVDILPKLIQQILSEKHWHPNLVLILTGRAVTICMSLHLMMLQKNLESERVQNRFQKGRQKKNARGITLLIKRRPQKRRAFFQRIRRNQHLLIQKIAMRHVEVLM